MTRDLALTLAVHLDFGKVATGLATNCYPRSPNMHERSTSALSIILSQMEHLVIVIVVVEA